MAIPAPKRLRRILEQRNPERARHSPSGAGRHRDPLPVLASERSDGGHIEVERDRVDVRDTSADARVPRRSQ